MAGYFGGCFDDHFKNQFADIAVGFYVIPSSYLRVKDRTNFIISSLTFDCSFRVTGVELKEAIDLDSVIEQTIYQEAQDYLRCAKELILIKDKKLQNVLDLMLLIIADIQTGIHFYDKLFLK